MDVQKQSLVAIALAVLLTGEARASSDSCARPTGRVEHVVCGSAKLRRLDAELGRLYDAIENETRGVDGETGEVIDPFGQDHGRWLTGVRNRCRTEACLAHAYRARIAEFRRRWADVL